MCSKEIGQIIFYHIMMIWRNLSIFLLDTNVLLYLSTDSTFLNNYNNDLYKIYERNKYMKKFTLIFFILFLTLTGCSSNDRDDQNLPLERINEISVELENIRMTQSDLLAEVERLTGIVNRLETSLKEKEEVLGFYRMEIDSLYNTENGQEDYFESRINEIIRLHGNDSLIEKMYLVEDYDFEEGNITVKDQNGDVFKYDVSVECKVLVVGQSYMIYQTLDEAKDFMDSVKNDEGNKVILVFKNNIVEQIKMYGHGEWR